MKYQNYEIDPGNIDLSDYYIKINKNFTFIFPKNNSFSKSQGIIYHRVVSNNFVVFGNLSHAHLFEVLFKALKISKDTRDLDCLVGSYKPSSQIFEWYKTEQAPFGFKKGFVVLNKILSADSRFKVAKVLESVFDRFLVTRKIIIPKVNFTRREGNDYKIKVSKRVFKKLI